MSSKFHNKFHRHNHHTTPTPDPRYPDASHDPIASEQSPFLGTFWLSSGDIQVVNGEVYTPTGNSVQWSLASTTAAQDVINAISNLFLPITGGTIEGNLEVTGNITGYSDLTVSNDLLVNGDAGFTNNSTVSGDLTIGNDLLVNGHVEFTSNAVVSGDLTVGNDLLVNGDAGFTNNSTVSGDLNVATGRYLSGGQDLGEIIASSSPKFTTDLTVNLAGGKTFGKYTTGQTIPATGKTPGEVIQMAIAEAINPTATLTSSTTIAFNQTAISNVLNFSHTINTLGATIQTASLEWRRNNTGTWTVLSTSTATPGTYTHTLTDTAFNAQPFNYRYVVTDTAGGTTTVTRDITPTAYAQPTVTLSVVGTTITSPETNATREKGNVSSTISGTITRQSPLVALQSYQLQYRVNSGTWTNIGSSVSITNGSTASITATLHNPTSDASAADTLTYRVQITDAYTTSTAVTTSAVTFYYLIFYGPSSTVPTNSAGVRALPNKGFTATLTNPFNILTGTTLLNFVVALPQAVTSSDTITSAIDVESSNNNITSQFVNTARSVSDSTGNVTSTYNVFTYTIAAPYSPTQHTLTITRG